MAQVRDEFRLDYDPGRGGFGKVVQKEIEVQSQRIMKTGGCCRWFHHHHMPLRAIVTRSMHASAHGTRQHDQYRDAILPTPAPC